MEFVWAIIIGGIAGAIAKFLMPGRDPGGFIITILLGIAGAVLASWLGRQMGIYDPATASGFGNFVAAIVGAIIILLIYRLIRGGRRA